MCVRVANTGLAFASVPVLRTAFGKPMLDVARCAALLHNGGEGKDSGGEWGGGHEECDARYLVEALSSIAFNVSHHGDWLLLLCAWGEGRLLLGCDVARVELPQRIAAAYAAAFPQPQQQQQQQGPPVVATAAAVATALPSLSAALTGASAPAQPFRACALLLADYLSAFRSLFSDAEWAAVQQRPLPRPSDVDGRAAPTDVEAAPAPHCLSAFFVLWSVKEATVKAVGHGLSMSLTAFQAVPAVDGARSAEPSAPQDRAPPPPLPPPPLYAPVRLDWRPTSAQSPSPCFRLADRPMQSGDSDPSLCPCAACCAALAWNVTVAGIDARHTAAVACARVSATVHTSPPTAAQALCARTLTPALREATQLGVQLIGTAWPANPHSTAAVLAGCRLVKIEELLQAAAVDGEMRD